MEICPLRVSGEVVVELKVALEDLDYEGPLRATGCRQVEQVWWAKNL